MKNLKSQCKTTSPSTSFDDPNIESVWSLVLSDQKITIHMLANMLYVEKSSVHIILKENFENFERKED